MNQVIFLRDVMIRTAAACALLGGGLQAANPSDNVETKTTLLLLIKEALKPKFLTLAFEKKEEQVLKNSTTMLRESFVRLTIDTRTGRYLAEEAVLARDVNPGAPLQPASYAYHRWDGKQTVAGSKRLSEKPSLPELGRPRIGTANIYDGHLPCGFADLTKRAAGLTLFGEEALESVDKMFTNPQSTVEFEQTPDANLVRIVDGQKAFKVDAATGQIFGSSQSDIAGDKVRTTENIIKKDQNGLPARATVKWTNANHLVDSITTTYASLPKGCRALTEDEFNSVIGAKLEPGTVVFDQGKRRM